MRSPPSLPLAGRRIVAAAAAVVVPTIAPGGAVGARAAPAASAFSPAPPRARHPTAAGRPAAATRLGLSPPDPSRLADHAPSARHAADVLRHHIASASSILAGAADAAADAAASAASSAAADGGGWWASYLNVFRSGLETVHGTIDGPLRSVGWDQTWGPSIAIFTVGVRSLLIPLSVQQSKASEYIKALKPYQDEIKEKFKDRKELQNRAIAKLYEDAGQNPLTGCLISLSQIPIFLGLYRSVTLLARDGELNEPFLWIPSLEGPVSAPTYRGMEWLTQGWTSAGGGGGLPVPSLGWETTLAYVAMPIILVVGQSVTMKALTPEMDDNMSEEERQQFEQSQGVLKFLPLLIGYFSLQVPAGLTIYWLMSNAFTLTQSLAVKAYYKANPPEIELPDYWDALDDVASMSPEERRAAAEAGINAGPKFEDLLDEAKFHYVVERNPLRESGPAWGRAAADAGRCGVPGPMYAWVAASGTGGPVSESLLGGREEGGEGAEGGGGGGQGRGGGGW